MCIRDRYGTVQGDIRITGSAVILPCEEVRNDTRDTFVPVSYTHLDVYKRQGLCRPVILDDVSLNAKSYERLAERLSKNDEQ